MTDDETDKVTESEPEEETPEPPPQWKRGNLQRPQAGERLQRFNRGRVFSACKRGSALEIHIAKHVPDTRIGMLKRWSKPCVSLYIRQGYHYDVTS